MYKMLFLMTVSGSCLFAAGESDYNDAVQLLKEARTECQKITDSKLKNKAYNCLDSAVIILDGSFMPQAGQVSSAVFFDIFNDLTHTPDKSTLDTLEKINTAEEKFQSCLLSNLKNNIQGVKK